MGAAELLRAQSAQGDPGCFWLDFAVFGLFLPKKRGFWSKKGDLAGKVVDLPWGRFRRFWPFLAVNRPFRPQNG